MMEADESFDDDEGPAPLIPVEEEDADFDLDVPPTSGNEYLRRVRMEASSCPQIVVADVNTMAFQHKQTVHVKQWSGNCHPAPKGFAPSLAWQKIQIDNFSENRQKLARSKSLLTKKGKKNGPRLPLANDVENWCRLCFGRLEPPSPVKEQIEESLELVEECDRVIPSVSDDSTGVLPLVSIVVAMDQPTVTKVLEYHLNWFEATGFSQKQGYWFYALLLSLDKPLLPDACDLIRRLARACSNLRASLENVSDSRLAPMNLFICLVSQYFDQSDLRDNIT